MVDNFTYQIILPSYEALDVAAEALMLAAQSFAENPNASNLDALQAAWLETNLAHMATTPFNFGLVSETRLHNRLDNRPPDIVTINEIIEGDTKITTDDVGSMAPDKVGLGTMEYLIFDPENGNEAVLAALQDGKNGDRRRAYLLALAQDIDETTSALENIWASEGSNYAGWFAESSGEMESSMNMLANQMLSDLEVLINLRVGFPLGKLSANIARPDQVEAPYSQMSLPRIIVTVTTLQEIYNGGEGSGLDDYLDFLEATYEDEPLSQVINAQFDTTLAALNAIEDPLATAVEANPAQVNTAYEELRKLLVLLKVDMVNQLGINLQFGDGD
jgi:predicted lipoprotein